MTLWVIGAFSYDLPSKTLRTPVAFLYGLAVLAVFFAVRNRWLFDFGLIACVLVIPYALVFGAVRGIPFWWRLIDCSFGVFGFVPLWFCRKWVCEIESLCLQRGPASL